MSLEGLEDRRMMSSPRRRSPTPPPTTRSSTPSTDTLHVIYYDTATKRLMYQGHNDDGTASAAQTVDATGDTGQYLSMAQDNAGVLHAAYYDVTNGDLKYARRDLAGRLVDADGRREEHRRPLPRRSPSTPTARPAISYYRKNSGDLKFAKFNGDHLDTSLVASADDVGRYPSLALNPDTRSSRSGSRTPVDRALHVRRAVRRGPGPSPPPTPRPRAVAGTSA